MTSTQGPNPGTPSGTSPGGGTATRTGRTGASFGTASNYNRMLTTFPAAPATAPTNWKQQPDGNWWSWDGATWHLQPQGPPPAPPTVGGAGGGPWGWRCQVAPSHDHQFPSGCCFQFVGAVAGGGWKVVSIRP